MLINWYLREYASTKCCYSAIRARMQNRHPPSAVHGVPINTCVCLYLSANLAALWKKDEVFACNRSNLALDARQMPRIFTGSGSVEEQSQRWLCHDTTIYICKANTFRGDAPCRGWRQGQPPATVISNFAHRHHHGIESLPIKPANMAFMLLETLKVTGKWHQIKHQSEGGWNNLARV